MTLRTLNYGNYGIFLVMGHAGFAHQPYDPKPLRILLKALKILNPKNLKCSDPKPLRFSALHKILDPKPSTPKPKPLKP